MTDIGENRDQEAAAKAAESAALAPLPLAFRRPAADQQGRAAWSRYADVVHSVDRLRLVDALAPRRREARTQRSTCLVQVDLDRPAAAPPRGRRPGGRARLADAVVAGAPRAWCWAG